MSAQLFIVSQLLIIRSHASSLYSSLSLFLKTMKPETMYIYKISKIVIIFSFYIDARIYEVKI